MPKYYLKSGQISYVVAACDVEGAALWAMHRIMDECICDYEDDLAEGRILIDPAEDLEREIDGIPEAIPYEAMLNGLAKFDETICMSQIGLGRDDAGELDTENIFHQWRQLMQAVDRLHDRLN